VFKNVHVDTIMTHTNETSNEIIRSYGSALSFSAQTKVLACSPKRCKSEQSNNNANCPWWLVSHSRG